MFEWLKRNQRKQSCCLLTEDGRLLDIQLRVDDFGYVVEHKTEEGWGLFPEACVPDEITGSPILIITERDAGPLCFVEGKIENYYCKKVKEAMKQIAAEAEAKARGKVQKKAESNKVLETVQLMVIVLGIGVVLLALLSKYTGDSSSNSIFASALIWTMGWLH